jgi:hypothetical protein
MTDAIPVCLELLELLVLFDTWARRCQVGFSRRRLQFWEVGFVHHWVENSVDFFWVYHGLSFPAPKGPSGERKSLLFPELN